MLRCEELIGARGERLAVLGPNGSGKTTLLRLPRGDRATDGGTCDLDGVRSRAGVGAGGGSATRRSAPDCSPRPCVRNVELPLRWRGLDGAARRRAALAALERLNIVHLADRKALSLSGGEAQRVSLARALALEPRLLLLDEPAAGLDAEARRGFFDDLELALNDRATTVVHVSHRAEETMRLGDQVMVLVDGAIRQLSTPATLIQQPANATVARLIGYDNVLSVAVDQEAQVLISGVPSGITSSLAPGLATLAVWASAIHLGEPDTGPLRATVERVLPGPGRWELILSAGETLQAHLPLDQSPPRAGDRVGVQIASQHATLIPRQNA